ncbi:DUF6049 family protein [Acidothermaceae bacterium B102]|nr:DUF6049 family protein [Acidothermaceae bacterium B102]
MPAVAILAVLGPLAAMPVMPATAQTAEPLPLTVTITRLSPTAPQPGDLVTVAGQITNPTSVEYDQLGVGLRIDPSPLLSRAALLDVVSANDHLPTGIGTITTIPALPPGATVPYELTLPADALHLTQAGVYRLSVEATIPDDEATDDGRVDTFLPWLPPSASVPPVQVAWVWPLLSTPHLQADNTFTNDTLTTEIGTRGRLGALLDVANQAAVQSGSVPTQRVPVKKGQLRTDPPPEAVAIRPVPVTPVIDPETVQELELMQDAATPYQVTVPSGGTSAGTGQVAATAYLAALRQLMGHTSSIAVPYADPDLEALSSADASSLITQARSTGLEATLPGVVAGLVWPPNGVLSETALDQLTTSGLVLSSTAAPLTATPAYTPTAVTTVDRTGGTVPAVVVDDGLSHLVTKQTRAADRVLLTQRFAAETAAIAVEGLATTLATRALVIAPGRRWSPTNTAVRALLAETGRLPWLTPVTVPQVLQQDQPDPAVTRAPLQAPSTTSESGLPLGVARQIAAANTELAGFRSILCPVIKSATGAAPVTTTTAAVVGAPSSLPTSSTATSVNCNRDDQVLMLQRSLYRTASSAFAKPASGGEALLSSTLTTLRAAEGKVSIVTKGQVNLLGNRARLPITIANDLTVPVKVQLVLVSRSPGLTTTSKAQTLVILAGTKPQLDVTVNTVKAGAGTLLVDAQLLTPEGKAFGPPTRLTVRVSAYGAVIVWITVVVCSLLGLAVVVRLYRRIRNARRASPPDEAAPAEPA